MGQAQARAAAGAELWIQWLVSETDEGPLATAWTAALVAAFAPGLGLSKNWAAEVPGFGKCPLAREGAARCQAVC